MSGQGERRSAQRVAGVESAGAFWLVAASMETAVRQTPPISSSFLTRLVVLTSSFGQAGLAHQREDNNHGDERNRLDQ